MPSKMLLIRRKVCLFQSSPWRIARLNRPSAAVVRGGFFTPFGSLLTRLAAPCLFDGAIKRVLPRLCRADSAGVAEARRDRHHGHV
jgi:hypothetical protein